jgi:hypothetical protein
VVAAGSPPGPRNSTSASRRTSAKKAHPGIRVDGLHPFAKRLTERGAEVIWDYDLPGYERFYSEDPVGNRLEFLQPVAMRP